MRFVQLARLSLAIGLAAWPSVGWPAGEPDLIIYTEDYEPFYYRDDAGEIAGIVTTLVREISLDADLSIDIRLAPFKRGLHAVSTHPDHCFMALWRTDTREPDFSWVGPLQIDGFAYFAPADSPIELKTHEDSFAYRTGAVAGWTSTLAAQNAGHRKLTLVDNDVRNLDMLRAGRVDLWLGGLLSAPYIAAQQGYEIKNAFTLQEVDLSLACNPDTNPVLLDRLRQALSKRAITTKPGADSRDASELTQ